MEPHLPAIEYRKKVAHLDTAQVSMERLLERLRREQDSWQSEDRDAVAADIARLQRLAVIVARWRPPIRHDVVRSVDDAERASQQLSAYERLTLLLSTLERMLRAPFAKKAAALPAPSQDEVMRELVSALREVQRAERNIDLVIPRPTVLALAEQEHAAQPAERKVLDTSLTLDYQAKEWGVRRIALDGISNHLPADSMGSQVGVLFEVNGQWVGISHVPDKRLVTAIRFVDDGVGYDAQNLRLMGSLKTVQESSVGQFGEGIKMISTAALREGMDIEFASVNWTARAKAVDESLQNMRTGSTQPVSRLAFDLMTYPKEDVIRGSRTTIRQLTPEFVDEVLQLNNTVLALNPDYRPLDACEAGEIVDTKGGRVYVRGVLVHSDARTVLSYNLNTRNINRDRSEVYNLGEHVRKIVDGLSSGPIIRCVLKKAFEHKDEVKEEWNYWLHFQHRSIWKSAFYDVFGAEAVLNTGFRSPKHVPMKRIDLPIYIKEALKECGVKRDEDVVPDTITEELATSFTLDYGAGTWTSERILLDAIQNHLPADSGGRTTRIYFKERSGSWYPYEEVERFRDEDIVAVNFADDGKGYDYEKLALLTSDKAEDAAGKFGEGLKMISTAALREGMVIEFNSRNWKARPRAVERMVDSRAVQQVVFDVEVSTKGQAREGSSTVLTQLTPACIAEFRALKDKIINESTRAVLRVGNRRILRYTGGALFVRHLYIPGNHNLLFSYDFGDFEIGNRDRNAVSADTLRKEIGDILGGVEDTQFARFFLGLAAQSIEQGTPPATMLEFSTQFVPRYAHVWKQAWIDQFGDRAIPRSASSLDFISVGQVEHVGYRTVTVPEAVAQALQHVGLKSLDDVMKQLNDVDWLRDKSQWTEKEREIIPILHEIVAMLPNAKKVDIFPYTPKKGNTLPPLGLGGEDRIGILRTVFEGSLEHVIDVCVHECGHTFNNNAPDASPEFRNYLTLALAQLILKRMNLKDK